MGRSSGIRSGTEDAMETFVGKTKVMECDIMGSAGMQQMDPSVWASLPEHLLEKILSRLPVRSFCRFRSVCKGWNDLVSCSSFLKACEDVPSCGPLFLVYTADKERIEPTYDPDLRRWHRIRLPSLPLEFDPFHMAYDGGLICYYTFERVVVVLNPLTKHCRTLPPMRASMDCVHMVCMVTDRLTHSYQVFVAGTVRHEEGFFIIQVEMYDSRNDSWANVGVLSSRIKMVRNMGSRGAVYSSGCVHVICYDEPKGLLAFDLDDQIWSRIASPLPAGVSQEDLVQWNERIFMIGCRVDRNGFGISGICLWELQTDGWDWVCFDMMPQHLFEAFSTGDEHDDFSLSCTSCCHLMLLVSCRANVEVPSPQRYVLYDFKNKSWTMVEGIRSEDKYSEPIGYEPRLDAIV